MRYILTSLNYTNELRKDIAMSQYTEYFIYEADALSPDDDDYEEKLRKIFSEFHGFDESLTIFLTEHGYTGDPSNILEKAKFVRDKFKKANVELPRSYKEWFVANKVFSRTTAYQICFAFGLGVDETNDFFKRVQFERGFDCHTIDEAVYYFCMKNGLSYSEANEIIRRIPVPQKEKVLPEQILYTDTIIDYLNSVGDKEKLIKYITDNNLEFRYNNATAIKYIEELWIEISKANGLAEKEGEIIKRSNNGFRDIEENVKMDDYVVAAEDSSTWTIFSQIIGLRNDTRHEYATKYDRSLVSVFSGNPLMPLRASFCFPSQKSIDGLLRGKLGDNEIVRKMLILLVFYTYWARLIIQKDDAFYTTRRSDRERCMDTINGRLLGAGYPTLYAGNPYDWVFMWALNNEHPIEAFRAYMDEVFAIKSEQNTIEE